MTTIAPKSLGPGLPLDPKDCPHSQYRVVECKDDVDTCQCYHCGHTWKQRCNFDEEYS